MVKFIQQVYFQVYSQFYSEEGQDLVEYALVMVLVALSCVAGVNNVASAVNTVFSNISTTLS
jgi:pilus assembly protein Flp/PilA